MNFLRFFGRFLVERSQQVGNRYPWYDSIWLTKYVHAKEMIQQLRPEKMSEFVAAFERLRTRPDFQVKLMSRVFEDTVMDRITQTIRTFQLPQLELHETKKFGRFVVHDHPFFTELQLATIALVSEAAGEEVEPAYNFVSLYKKLGVCPVHMDSPESKWTLDLCIDQSDPWPIHLSQIVPWPEDSSYEGDGWQEAIKHSPKNIFTSHTLEPGKAVLFSGSSQWHYRDPLPLDGKVHFCHLVFFHFVPKGMRDIVKPKNWPRLFGIPELAEVV